MIGEHAARWLLFKRGPYSTTLCHWKAAAVRAYPRDSCHLRSHRVRSPLSVIKV